jgi:hypothetical protein
MHSMSFVFSGLSMYRQSKQNLSLTPVIAGIFLILISSSAFARNKLPKGLIEPESAVPEQEQSQDNQTRQSGEAARTPETVQQQQQLPERFRQRNNQRNEQQNEQQENQRLEFSRQENARNSWQQQEQINQQNRLIQQQTEREAAAQRIALLRNNANNQRYRDSNENDRDDSPNDRRHHERQRPGNYSGTQKPIAFTPSRPGAYQKPLRAQDNYQQRQANDYYRHLDRQNSIAIRFNERLRDQNRHEQYRSQQRYYERMNQQRRYHDNHHDAYNSSYYHAPAIYRYQRSGNDYYANRYQADLMRQAINYGYEEGFYAGRADRTDRWNYNFRDAYAYQDANYGYNGYYVDRGTYNYYFREGFRRGYDDGYYSRYQYGRRDNNRYTPHSAVLNLILNFSN